MSDVTIVDPNGLGDDVRAALKAHILTLADSKRLMGIRYSDWLLGAPSIETGIAASSMCQDEWGHARLLYAMLKDLDLDPTKAEQDREAARYQSVDGLDREFADWAEVVAANVVIDAGIAAALRGFANGGFETAQTRVPKMLAEEAFHQDFGSAWVRKAAEASGQAKEAVRAAALGFLPRTLAWMDPADDAYAVLVRAGLTESGDQIRARYEAWAGDVLEVLGIDVATVEPDRSDYDPNRRRGPGHPDEEAVERARGDRNRALFVE